MQSKTDLIIQELQKLFRGEYDPWEFSCTFPDVVYNNYDELEKDTKGLDIIWTKLFLIYATKANRDLIRRI